MGAGSRPALQWPRCGRRGSGCCVRQRSALRRSLSDTVCPPRLQAGYTAEPAYALDGDDSSFWSSTGGATCCTESAPAWLRVSLGALRPVAALQLHWQQDLSLTLSLGNASGGPWATVATRGCDVCQQNGGTVSAGRWLTAVLPATVTASYAQLMITWSAAGGVGGCDDLCDFSTDVFTFAVWGPGVLPAGDGGTESPPGAPPAPCASVARPLGSLDAAAVLTGDAVLSAPGSGYDGRSQSMQLTAAQSPGSAGAAEFTAIIRPMAECPCDTSGWGNQGMLLITAWVWLGGGVLTGEGLVLSFVDSSKQTPGKMTYMRGCGVSASLPADAMSIVFDTADSDPACDAPGMGVRLVSTLRGAEAPPLVVGSTLEQGTSSFRQSGWVPVQVVVATALFRSGAAELAAQSQSLFVPRLIFVNGTTVISSDGVLGLHSAELQAVNATLEAMYLVVSARTGAGGGDAHAVSGVRVECYYGITGQLAAEEAIINWAGLRQPYAPPRGFRQLPPPPAATALQAQRGNTEARTLAFASAFGATLAAFTAAAAAVHWHRGRRAARRRTDVEFASLLEVTAAADAEETAEVLLLCTAEDALLADAVQAKLRLAGMRVCVAPLAADAALDAGVLRALRAAHVFAPLVTLPLLQRIARAAAAGEADAVLASWLAALHCHDGAAATTTHLLAIRPLLVGSTLPDASPPQWSNLLLEPAYARLLAALPDTAPAASAAALDAALRQIGAALLPARFAALTAREIVLGRAAGGSGGAAGDVEAMRDGGVLSDSGEPLFTLACAHEDLGLYLRDRYVKVLREDLLLRRPLAL